MRIRWRIFALLFSFALIAYVQQKSLTIAAARIMPELGLSQLQIGWLEQAFVLSYTLFQLPGALLGQRLGARLAYTLFGLVAFIATIATPLAPVVLGGSGLFAALLAAQFLLGLGQAGRWPVAAGVYASWFPARQWPLVQGLAAASTSLGAAIAAPLIASLTATVGWQRAIAWSSCPALIVLALWIWYARDVPSAHRSVTREELAEIGARTSAQGKTAARSRHALRALLERNLLLLTLSYTMMNYCFFLLSNWCFLYLLQERHFSLIQSGWLAMAPPLAAAAGAAVGGALAARLCRRLGMGWGFRIVPLSGLAVAALLLMTTPRLSNPYVAVVALTLCFGCLELTEGSFWGATTTVGRDNAMVASGLVNAGGLIGGIIGIPLVAYLSGHHSWSTAFTLGSLSAAASALLWLGIDASASTAGATERLQIAA
ncbi:MAG TPA: MFS transporter [Steroidobacteraceae bacterium]|nr:MFS transporter [Steroidobacteraceae bacterium]